MTRDLLREAMAIAVFGALLSGASGHGETVQVTSERVNLRAAPRPNAEVVGQVSRGDVLTAPDGITGEWVKVVPPRHANAWVYSDLIRDGVVCVSAAQVRSGPGINYRVIGQLHQGDAVRVTGTHGDGEWLRIEPPADAFVWISAEYVKPEGQADTAIATPPPIAVVEAPSGSPPVTESSSRKPPRPARYTAPPPRSSAEASPVPEPTRAVSASEKMVGSLDAPGKPQAERVVAEGTLLRSMLVWRRPSRYSLVGRDERGRSHTVCFVQGDWRQLSPRVGSRVRVTGERCWVQGVRDPVVTMREIVAVP